MVCARASHGAAPQGAHVSSPDLLAVGASCRASRARGTSGRGLSEQNFTSGNARCPHAPSSPAALLAAGLSTAPGGQLPLHRSTRWDIDETARLLGPESHSSYVSEKSGVKLQLKIGRTSADTTSRRASPRRSNSCSATISSARSATRSARLQPPRPALRPDRRAGRLADPRTRRGAQGQEVALPGRGLHRHKVPYAHLASGHRRGRLRWQPERRDRPDVRQQGQGHRQQPMLIDGYARRERTKFRILWTSGPTTASP